MTQPIPRASVREPRLPFPVECGDAPAYRYSYSVKTLAGSGECIPHRVDLKRVVHRLPEYLSWRIADMVDRRARTVQPGTELARLVELGTRDKLPDPDSAQLNRVSYWVTVGDAGGVRITYERVVDRETVGLWVDQANRIW